MIRLGLFLGVLLLMSCEPSTSPSTKVSTEVATSYTTLPYYNEASFSPHWLGSNPDSTADFHRIPDFNLINQDGDTISQNTFENKIYVSDFFFTACPGICPKLTANFAVLQEEFLNDDEVLLLSHSVTPNRDTVPVLKKYADKKGVVSHKWHLATGNRQVIYALGRQAYFIEEDLGFEKSDDEFLHTENIVLVDKNRHIRGIYNGLNNASIQQLILDIQSLKQES